jgi:hypothetical protein
MHRSTAEPRDRALPSVVPARGFATSRCIQQTPPDGLRVAPPQQRSADPGTAADQCALGRTPPRRAMSTTPASSVTRQVRDAEAAKAVRGLRPGFLFPDADPHLGAAAVGLQSSSPGRSAAALPPLNRPGRRRWWSAIMIWSDRRRTRRGILGAILSSDTIRHLSNRTLEDSGGGGRAQIHHNCLRK